jgi:hypothetical protein
VIDFSRIKTYPIQGRKNKFTLASMVRLDAAPDFDTPGLDEVALAIRQAAEEKRPSIFMLGGAVVKEGCGHILIDLMKKGFIQHLGVNGAVSIHDVELALIGETSEDVTRGLQDGTFGMVDETGRLMNEALKLGNADGIGYGASIARMIATGDFPHKEHSVFYHAHQLEIPITVHIAIGGDIIHQHPTCDGAVLGATSFLDFQILTQTVSGMHGGAMLNIGSAVNLPEVFLKALTVARNLGHDASSFTTANFDFLDLYRPRTRIVEWPKVLGCLGYDIRGGHRETLPALRRKILGQ